MAFTQDNRLIAIETPLGKDVLLLQGFTGREAISRLFTFHLDLASEKPPIEFKDIIGQNVTIRLFSADGKERFFNGFVSRFAHSGTGKVFSRYQMEVVPRLWFLTRVANCRIYQEKTIPQIVEAVLKDHGVTDYKLSLDSTYNPLEYVVQYRETDFNFVSRLMEQYGIFYFFEHSQGKHTMVLGDSSSAHQPCPQDSTAYYDISVGHLVREDVVTGWHLEQEFRSGKYSLRDYNFETPSTDLTAVSPSLVKVADNDKFELYDYPGDYLTHDQGQEIADLRMGEEEAGYLVATGSSVCRGFASGHKFTLSDHPRNDMNQSFVLTEVQHVASVGSSYSLAGDSSGEHYTNHFTCIPASVTFRPLRITPKPFVQGPQTALVVGKSGEEIWVDKYGRIKVQFYWDRYGQKDENSSCWIRVSQPWAGGGWGGMWIPRMGQEVVVDFLEGDPDRPLITGRVYNAEELVPYTLPDHQTVSTTKSRSSKGGGDDNYNEIRFEDKKGSEQIFINAEKDMDLRVENDSREFIGANRHLVVTKDQLEEVDGDKHAHVKGKHLEAVDGDHSLKITGDEKIQIGNNQSIQVGQTLNEKFGQNWASETVQTVHIKAGMTMILEAGMQLSLKGPGGFVDIGPTGVTIQGTMVLINSGGAAGSGPGASPQSPDAPKDPDKADDGKKFGKS